MLFQQRTMELSDIKRPSQRVQTVRWKADSVSLVHSWACRRLHFSFKVPSARQKQTYRSSRPVTRLYILAFEWGVGAEKWREVSQWKHVIFTFSTTLESLTLDVWQVPSRDARMQHDTEFNLIHTTVLWSEWLQQITVYLSSRIWIQTISTTWT